MGFEDNTVREKAAVDDLVVPYIVPVTVTEQVPGVVIEFQSNFRLLRSRVRPVAKEVDV